MKIKNLFFYLSLLLMTLWSSIVHASGRSHPTSINDRINIVRKKLQEKASKGDFVELRQSGVDDGIAGEWINWNNWGNWANWNNWNNWANWANWGNWRNF